jgi:hypothetical protein
LCRKSPQGIEKKEVECRQGPVEEERRLLLAGSQLSGKLLEKVEMNPERFPDMVGARPKERLASSSCKSVARQELTVKEYN